MNRLAVVDRDDGALTVVGWIGRGIDVAVGMAIKFLVRVTAVASEGMLSGLVVHGEGGGSSSLSVGLGLVTGKRRWGGRGMMTTTRVWIEVVFVLRLVLGEARV